jgi:hypothetical protein
MDDERMYLTCYVHLYGTKGTNSLQEYKELKASK